MVAYIQQNRFGDAFSESTKIAEQGFEALGVEVQTFKQLSEIINLNKEDIVVGGVASVNQAFTKSPKAYILDVGITDNDLNVLIEVNDAYSISSYGLSPVLYAKYSESRKDKNAN